MNNPENVNLTLKTHFWYDKIIQFEIKKPPVMIKWLPATIFSACSITVAFLLLLLPETMGEPLYESMASAEAAWENKNENKDKNNDNKSSRDDEESDVLLKPRLSQGFSTLNGQS